MARTGVLLLAAVTAASLGTLAATAPSTLGVQHSAGSSSQTLALGGRGDSAPAPGSGVVAPSPGAAPSTSTGPVSTTSLENAIQADATSASTLTASGIPTVALRAYAQAQSTLARSDASCHLPWALLAGIGRIESNHGRTGGATLHADGLSTPPILGPVLDGAGDFAAVPDTDHGRLDGNTTWDRAVGPMQFLPGTWSRVGVDADGRGGANPFDINDAATGAGIYLCADGRDLSTMAGLVRAVYSYNPSNSYVATVLATMRAYAAGGIDVPAVAPGSAVHVPTGTLPVGTGAAKPKPGAPTSPTPAPSTSRTWTSPPTTTGSPSPAPSPATAVTLAATTGTDHSLTAGWTASPTSDVSYTVTLTDKDGTTVGTKTVTTTAHSIVLDATSLGLTAPLPDGSYTAHVTAVLGGRSSSVASSAPFTVTTATSSPSPPGGSGGASGSGSSGGSTGSGTTAGAGGAARPAPRPATRVQLQPTPGTSGSLLASWTASRTPGVTYTVVLMSASGSSIGTKNLTTRHTSYVLDPQTLGLAAGAHLESGATYSVNVTATRSGQIAAVATASGALPTTQQGVTGGTASTAPTHHAPVKQRTSPAPEAIEPGKTR